MAYKTFSQTFQIENPAFRPIGTLRAPRSTSATIVVTPAPVPLPSLLVPEPVVPDPGRQREYKTTPRMRATQKQRRADLSAGGWCINGEGHGKRLRGPRCMRCYHVWKHGYDKAVELGLITVEPVKL